MAERPAPSFSAAAPGGHLSAMQLFYELKQKFPTAPDPVVSECIRQSRHDPERCEALLRASCASRGFPASAPVGRRFSAPPAGVALSTTGASGTTTGAVSSGGSRERSAGRNSMCALAERTSTSISRSSSNSSTASTTTTTAAAGSIDNHRETPPCSISTAPDNPVAILCGADAQSSNPRAKLRPTFLNTRPPQGLFTNTRIQQQQQDLRPPFLGGPLQEPHKYQCNSNIRRSSLKEQSTSSSHQFHSFNQQKQKQEFYSETYKCSVNQQDSADNNNKPPRVPDWPPREPTPPPRPPLPASMVQDPMLPPFCSNRFFQEEDFIQDYEVSVNCSASGVHVTSTCSSPVGGPIGSPMFQHQPSLKHTASLHVHPTPHFLARPASLTSVSSTPYDPRSYTSVNLTLRPPSSEPQPAIDIRSASRLTYSTSSYNPRQGFQSQLHIQIGSGGGTVSALRTSSQPPMGVSRNPSSPCSPPPYDNPTPTTPTKQHQVLVRTVSLPDVSIPADKQQVSTTPQAGLARQMERKAKLEGELRRERERLLAMQIEVHAMEKDLQLRQAHKAVAPLRGPAVPAPANNQQQRVDQLRAEILALQEQCKRMTQEVDLHGSQVPLGETDEEFYQNIYTGQRGFVLPQENLSQQSSWSIPPRPAAQPGHGVTEGTSVEDDEEDGPHWTCSVCTFRNHPALGKCEQCEMPRISLDVTEAETQDIHIRVTHSNFPARRVVHSWVV